MWEVQIPGHITALYIYAVINLLLLFHVTLVNGDVIVRDTFNSTVRTYEDYPATFGSRIPPEGVRGRLCYVTPHDACTKVDPPPHIDNHTLWIALIARSHNGCDFAVKILNAEKAGYNAAIVHNYNTDDNLVYMGAGVVGKDVKIPAVFVGWHSGTELSTYYQYEAHYMVTLDTRLPFNVKNYLFPFAAVMGGCLMIGCVVMMGRSCRNVARRHRSRLPSRHLKKIPIKKFKKGETYDVCAICLDEYEEGDKLRVLPCAHAYHCKCIDPWLTKNKRTCPVCKRRVIPRDQDSASESDSDEDEVSPAPTERTPLLGHSQTESHGSTSRRGTRSEPSVTEPARTDVTENNSTQDDVTSPTDSEVGAVGGVSIEDETTTTAAIARKVPAENLMHNVVASPPESDSEGACIEVVTVEPQLSEPISAEGRRANNHVV